MTFVVTDACIQCKYTGCVDCCICVPECPANAIAADVDPPSSQQHFLQLNAELARHPAWPVINVQKAPLIDQHRRRIIYLRLSVTDRRNYRCVYCMAEDMRFMPRLSPGCAAADRAFHEHDGRLACMAFLFTKAPSFLGDRGSAGQAAHAAR
jgi:ferredoxin